MVQRVLVHSTEREAGYQPKRKTRGAFDRQRRGRFRARYFSCQQPGSRAGALSAIPPSSHLLPVVGMWSTAAPRRPVKGSRKPMSIVAGFVDCCWELSWSWCGTERLSAYVCALSARVSIRAPAHSEFQVRP